jgi:hypothetical protein
VSPAPFLRFKAVAADVAASTSTFDYAPVEDDGLADGTFEVSEVRLVTEISGG